MAATGRNQGFHVLDEFVYEAVHAPSVPLADPAKQGRNAGLSVVEELAFDAGAGLDEALKSEAGRVAAMISASPDPVGSTARFQKLLLDELATMRRTA